MRAARVDPAAVDRRPSASGSRRGSTPPGRLGRPAGGARAPAHGRPPRGEAARRRARGAEPRAAGRRGADPARGDRAGRGVAPAERARRGYVLRRRGLARGRDRHRRLAPRRALPPARRPDRRQRGRAGRDRAARSPTFDLHGGLAACAAHLGRFGGHRAAAGLSIEPDRLEAFAEAFAAHADGSSRRRTCGPLTIVDADRPGERADARARAELDRLAPFGLGNPELTLLARELRGGRRRDRRRGQAPPLPRPAARPRRAAARSRSGWAPSSTALRAGRLRRRVPAEGEPLERDGRAAARRPARVRRPRRLRRAARLARGRVARRRGRLDARGARDLRRARADAERGRATAARVGRFRALLARGGAERRAPPSVDADVVLERLAVQ